MHTQIVIRLSTLTIIQERKKMIYVTPRARNQIEIEIVLHQKQMGAGNYDQKCMEKGENQNLTTAPFPEKN